ncbi:MAG: hypothetical protein Q9165_004316 [Trypethelium subeluteriae]
MYNIEDQIRNVTTAYGTIVDNLQSHANGQYPSEEYLLSRIRSGPTSYGLAAIGALQQGGSISSGAQLLLDVLDSSEESLYVQVWGGANTLAEGLWQANKTRSPADLAVLVSKLRVYTISDQDNTGAWIRLHFPQLRFINSIHGWNQYGLAAWCGISGEKYYAFDHGGPDSSLVSDAWIAQNIQVGPLGSHYPDVAYIMEGDSPSQLFNYDNGLNVPDHPEYGGWGGRYLSVDVSTVNGQHYSDATDQVIGQNGELFISNHATIWRWREAFQHEFAARMQWTLRRNGPRSNTTHPPVVVVNGSCGSQPIEINVKPSEKVVLDASETYDPDHPDSASSLSFEWWHYRDITATQWNVDAEVPKLNVTAIQGSNGRVISVEMPTEDLACTQLSAPTSSGLKYCQQYHMIVQIWLCKIFAAEMVSRNIIESSNDRIKSTLPGLVAVFAGGTSGVGETTVRQFAKYATRPRVYIIGRSGEAGERIVGECKALNPEGTFIFMKRETSLIRNVDEICHELTGKEEVINLLFLSVGTLQIGMKTEEGLHYSAALGTYGRSRFISNLLPLIRRATGLRRVVSVFQGTYEGEIKMTDFQGWNLGLRENQGHKASIATLDLEAHHKAAPEVSFVHNFPGAVESGIGRGSIGGLMRVLKTIQTLIGPLVNIPLVEAGDRHVFFCTSARFSTGPEDTTAGIPLIEGLDLARGTDGQIGSGVYSIDANGESANSTVEELLAQLRKRGMVDQVRERMESDINAALASSKDN